MGRDPRPASGIHLPNAGSLPPPVVSGTLEKESRVGLP